MRVSTGKAVGRLGGVIAALPTPMDERGNVDLTAMTRLVAWLVERGVHGVFACGTTGESPYLSDDERVALVRAAVEGAGGHIPVIAHVGAATTAATAALARRCTTAGTDALAVVTPFYFEHTEAEIATHFATVAAAVPDHPVLAYNIPARTGNRVSTAVVRALAASPNVVGLKDSEGDAYGLLEVAAAAGKGFRLVVGADPLVLQAVAMKWAGIVSGPASAIPEPFVELWRAAAQGSWSDIAAAYRTIAAVCLALRNGSIPRIKAALALRGLMERYVRAPLHALSDLDVSQLRDELAAFL